MAVRVRLSSSSSSLSPEGSALRLSFSSSSATVTCVGNFLRRALGASRSASSVPISSFSVPEQVGDAVARRAESAPLPVDPVVQHGPD